MKKRYCLYALLMALFVLYLVFANQIISIFVTDCFRPDNGAFRVENNSVRYGIDILTDNDNTFFETISFEGWTYLPTDQDNTNKQIGLVLMNEENIYSYISAPNRNRGDLSSQEKRGTMHGGIFSPSTILVKDGTYHVGIYCYENTYDYGYIKTEYLLTKKGTAVKIEKWNSAEAQLKENESITADAKTHLDGNRIEDGVTVIEGWSFIPDQDPRNSETYVMLTYDDGTSVIYDTIVRNRPDLAAAFGNEVYEYSGFRAQIPAELLHSEEYSVSILMEDKNGIHTSTEMLAVVQSGLGIAGVEGTAVEKRHSNQINLDSGLKVEANAKTHIDVNMVENGHVIIKGWGFMPDQDPETKDTYILLTHEDGTAEIFDTNVQNRPDLATGFKNEMYANAGFQMEIPEELLYSDEYSVSILLIDEKGIYTSSEMLTAVQNGLAAQELVAVESPVDETSEEANAITKLLAIPLNALMKLCYNFTDNYIIAIIVFTLLTKIILLPITLWMQRNSIKMVELMPDLNELKIKYFGDKETIAEETQVLYKQKGYHPLLSTLPMIIQIVLLMGVIEAVKALLGDSDSWLLLIPSEQGGITLLMPLAAGFAAFLLSLAQCKISPLQREQPKAEQLSTGAVSVCISLFLGAFVSLGTGVYWIASNLISIPMQVVSNFLVNPKKYVDYEKLAASRKKLADMEGLDKQKKEGYFSENKRRERADYKRFFSIANKHLVFYSEASGFYKYFKNTIEYLLAHSKIVIHYITNDPNDQIFKLAEKEPRIRAYYIGKQKCITLFMKMDADIVVMTTPDLDNFYLKRSYIRKDIEYIYTPHGVGSTNMTTRRGAYDHFDTFFCTGQHQIDELRETETMHQLKPKNLVPCGYGVLDQLLESFALQKDEKKERPRILIAPSWQEDNILDSCIDAILEEFMKKDYQVVVRPHPEYVKRYKPRMDALITRYQASIGEKLSFETDFSSNFNVFASDLMVTDWSGIAYEFSFCTKRPSLFINTKMKIFNPDYDKYSKPAMDITSRDELGVSLNPDEVGKINTIVDDMLQFKDRYAQRISDYMNENMFCVGGYGEATAKYILKQLVERKKHKNE